MRRSILISQLLFICLVLTNCKKDETDPVVSCGDEVIIDSDQYHNALISDLTITDLEINDNCLKINYTSGGCDGESWVLKLIDSEGVFESFPPQRDLILSLVNNEDCEVLIGKEVIFDITELQVDGGQVQLNIVNTEDNILYTY